MKVEQIGRNLHRIELSGSSPRLAVLSDLHWDNPKCDRVKLKRHLEYCKENNIPIFVNGDFFCLMQGKYDPRRNKKDILPEHNKVDYIDAVIKDAVNYFKPYAELFTVFGYGNHETGIVKNLETDPLRRFVDLMNYECNTSIQVGGYGGWVVLNLLNGHSERYSLNIKYFHGSGGGGIVTKGAINLTRALEMYEGMDIFLLGHIHENWCRNDTRDSLEYNFGKRTFEIQHKNVHHCITGTYKDDYVDGAFGWANERGMPPKPTGGRILTFDYFRRQDHGVVNRGYLIDSIKFPI